MIHQKDKVRYGAITIQFHIIKTGRIKTSEVIVGADTITVRAPYGKDKLEIQRLILDKASWILKKQRKYRETIPAVTKPSFEENTDLPYLGVNYPLKIDKEQIKDSIDLVDGKFVVKAKPTKITSNRLKKLYENWLREKAQVLFKDKVQKYTKKLGVKVRRITIKNLRNRWGSLTETGVINLNLNLMKASEDVIDYIIVHELCHLQIKEHSHHYWDLVRKYMPDYQDKEDWLRANAAVLV
jgi:predicted metal-dependent hydrolase